MAKRFRFGHRLLRVAGASFALLALLLLIVSVRSAPGDGIFAPSAKAASPVVGKQLVQVRAQVARWKAWLARPAQVAARAASQTAYEGEAGLQAHATDDAAFPELAGPVSRQTSNLLGSGGHVLHRLGMNSASVQTASGR